MKRGFDKSAFETLLYYLAEGKAIPAKYNNHALHGKYRGYMECHIQPDWLLVWKYENDKLILYLADTGTHSDLF